MTATDQALDATLDEPRDVADFIQALGISAHELELIAIVTGWQKCSPRKITAEIARHIKAGAHCIFGTKRALPIWIRNLAGRILRALAAENDSDAAQAQEARHTWSHLAR